jgi:hypothetical protein
MKKVFVLFSTFYLLLLLPTYADDASLGDPEVKLRKQWCSSQRTSYECRELSSGELCELNGPTKCY